MMVVVILQDGASQMAQCSQRRREGWMRKGRTLDDRGPMMSLSSSQTTQSEEIYGNMCSVAAQGQQGGGGPKMRCSWRVSPPKLLAKSTCREIKT
jgi:hypothetical protein